MLLLLVNKPLISPCYLGQSPRFDPLVTCLVTRADVGYGQWVAIDVTEMSQVRER